MTVWKIAGLAATLLAAPTPALAWGKTGHRAAAAVADTHLSGLARARVQQILGAETLDEASTWPDEQRSNPDPFWQKTASPWHYVTVGGFTYDRAPSEGDAVTALQRFSAALRDPAASREQQQLALRFIVHIVTDLHQPLHVGKGDDRGGNDVKVTWFGRPTNLHAVWDSALVDEEALSFSEWAERLRRHSTPEDTIANWVANPQVWISESAQIRDTIYPDKPELGYDYVYRHTPTVRRRLQLAGIRLAAYLNHLLEDPAAPAAAVR
jgi:hypothetical protein